jgi:hypothetical protein
LTYSAALPRNTEANRIKPFAIHQKAVWPLATLRKRASRLNYICKLKVPSCNARSFSSVGMEATALCATQEFR